MKNFTKIFEKRLDKKIFSAAAAFYLTKALKYGKIGDGSRRKKFFDPDGNGVDKGQQVWYNGRRIRPQTECGSDGSPQMKKSYSTQRIR